MPATDLTWPALRRQRLIIQQIEIRHIYQHQSRLGIFVHSEVETRLVFDKDTAPCHILFCFSRSVMVDWQKSVSATTREGPGADLRV